MYHKGYMLVTSKKKKYLFLERFRKSNNAWLRALMQSDCSYSSLFFEHYNRILPCDWVLGHCSISSFEGVSWHNAFVLYLASTSLGSIRPTLQSCCTKCYGLANNSVRNVSVALWFSNAVAKRSVKQVSVTLWFSLQCRCKRFCSIRFYQPALCRKCVF